MNRRKKNLIKLILSGRKFSPFSSLLKAKKTIKEVATVATVAIVAIAIIRKFPQVKRYI